MTVRDYAAIGDACELVAWDVAFDHARMVKSELELESVRDSVRINTEGFWVFLESFAPGKTEREVLAPCEEYFVSQGCGRWTMDMVLDGPNGGALPEFKIAGAHVFEATDCILPSLEVAGPGGHWVEVSRAICPGEPSDDTKRMLDAYEEYYAAAPARCSPGAPRTTRTAPSRRASSTAASTSGTSPGHSIGMTMIEFPKIGEGVEIELAGGDGALDAPARDRGRRAVVPLHAGHVARHRRRRRAARRAADADLRRHRDETGQLVAKWSCGRRRRIPPRKGSRCAASRLVPLAVLAKWSSPYLSAVLITVVQTWLIMRAVLI